MREIKYIVLHCTATNQTTPPETILSYWKNVLCWESPGYHYLIGADGTIHALLSIDQVANGVFGHNANSIHISYIGGIDENGNALDNRTPKQILSLQKLIIEYKKQFPSAEILGHKDFPGIHKECPSFNVKDWLKDLKI